MGGEHDVEDLCNLAELAGPSPMENILWPRGAAPAGRYKVWVVIANPEGMASANTFILLVLLRGEVVSQRTGRVAELQERPATSWILLP